MNLTDLLSAAGGNSSLGELAGNLGIGGSQAADLVSALGPALTRGLQKNSASDDGLAGLKTALAKGNHQRYIDDPSLMRQASARDDGNKNQKRKTSEPGRFRFGHYHLLAKIKSLYSVTIER